ncbi:hypothetical protein N658DRAFT_336351 [Parathielavia hyrcaniae]|uniref:Uncharacterized protein n=1 Tax=Parathielavia hyrcaniae TaxID=113614 RepID=A0AAN6T364_9PEZI|nr:hypothetical protein N658DRAFT_336351 [Parathielavia hyrcaniae]
MQARGSGSARSCNVGSRTKASIERRRGPTCGEAALRLHEPESRESAGSVGYQMLHRRRQRVAGGRPLRQPARGKYFELRHAGLALTQLGILLISHSTLGSGAQREEVAHPALGRGPRSTIDGTMLKISSPHENVCVNHLISTRELGLGRAKNDCSRRALGESFTNNKQTTHAAEPHLIDATKRLSPPWRKSLASAPLASSTNTKICLLAP